MTGLLDRLPFGRDKWRIDLGLIALLLMYFAIYLKDIASAWISSGQAAAILVVAWALAIADIAKRRGWPGHVGGRRTLPVLVALLAIWATTLMVTGSANLSSYYLAIPCAALVVNTQPRPFMILMLLHMLLSLSIQAWEFANSQYAFVYVADDGTALDERLFAGGMDVFRAKGMFQGPLSAVAFGLWIAFFLRGSMVGAMALMLCAFLATGRLGMLAATILIVARLLPTRTTANERGSAWGRLAIVAAGTALVALLFAVAEENRLDFVTMALDVDNDQNVSRIYFWLTSLNQYLNYAPLNLLVGDFGFVLRNEGATENDFLRLLLDCGFLGFLLYTTAIALLIRQAWLARDRDGMVIVLMMIVLMNAFPFVQSLSSAVLFWVYAFVTLSRPTPRRPQPAGTRQRQTPTRVDAAGYAAPTRH